MSLQACRRCWIAARRVQDWLCRFLAQLLYPRDNVWLYRCSGGTLLRMGIMQKILGFNRRVRWPVHFTSTVSAKNITRAKPDFAPGFTPACYMQAINGIVFGEGVRVGPAVIMISANHNLENLELHDSAPPIVIDDYCWIGAAAIILPGVHLGKHTIVGAGSVVTQSFPEGDCVITGNPAKVKRVLEHPSESNQEPTVAPI